MEGIWNNIKQKLRELKKDKNAALRKCMGILLAGICLLVILWPSDKKNGFSGLDALTGTEQDKTSGGVTGKQQNGEYASDNGQGISGEVSSANSSYEDYIAFQEEKLRGILSQVKGVGTVSVMITLKDGGEKIIEKDVTKSDSESDGSSQKSRSETSVMTNADSSEYPYVSKTLEPEIEGVLVSCTGASDPTIAIKITEAVQALFDVPAHKIVVLEQE